MKILCFTSFTFAYLDRARVLFQTLRRHHPDWTLVALITDQPPPGVALEVELEDFDRVVWFEDLAIPAGRSWLFQHDVVEVCTAVKGPFLHQTCQAGDHDAVIYLDPDIAVINPLATVLDALERYDGCLTPHLLEPEDEEGAILDNELATLRTGIYNLGFVAIRTSGQGAAFARWWNDRLLAYCHDDIPRGLFVDQRWCDHVPAFFDRFTILRDPGLNVASWNLSKRHVTIDLDGAVRINGSLLKFWHFTKLGPTGDIMTRRYAGTNFEVHEVWNWYKRLVAAAKDPRVPERYWAYDRFDDGRAIQKEHRVLYRERLDLRQAFPDPFATGPNSYPAWLESEGKLTSLSAVA